MDAAGGSSVLQFFFLSGFVLAIGVAKSGRLESISGSVFRRYIRLMLPAVLAHYIGFKLFMQTSYYKNATYKN
jgi:peptidoglycan/LPS O-acetylase OafA/YrhL